MTDFQEILKKLMERHDLSDAEANFAFQDIMEGKINNSQIAAFLTSLKAKGETVQEIAAFARTMRSNAVKIAPKANNLIDTCGTGGDGKGTFNISTCVAFVAAGAGACVAKHGNRSASGRSGSADVLEELGVNIMIDAKTAERQLETIGISFLFAQAFHPTMKHVGPVRKELGFKTVFNVLGPLTNPSNAKRQLIGVYDREMMAKVAQAAALLGSEKALVVGSDIDEISVSAQTQVYEVSGGMVKDYALTPEEFGFKRADIASIRAADRKESAGIINSVLGGKDGPARQVTLLNAGAAIYVSGIAGSIKEGIKSAERSIDSGKALEKLHLLRDYDGHS